MPFPDRSFQLPINPHLSKVYGLLLDCIVLGFVFPTGTIVAKSICHFIGPPLVVTKTGSVSTQLLFEETCV